jgi:hypothetical protein
VEEGALQEGKGGRGRTEDRKSDHLCRNDGVVAVGARRSRHGEHGVEGIGKMEVEAVKHRGERRVPAGRRGWRVLRGTSLPLLPLACVGGGGGRGREGRGGPQG